MPKIKAVGRDTFFSAPKRERSIEEVPFSMALRNELMHECFPKHTRLGTARMKQDKIIHFAHTLLGDFSGENMWIT